jgi:hypothetical protein
MILRERLISPFEHPPSGTEGYYFFDREPVSTPCSDDSSRVSSAERAVFRTAAGPRID